MALIRFAFWTTIFLLSTFSFTVLFEHGPYNFFENAKKEKEAIAALVGKKIDRKKDESEKLPPTGR